ncbi:hypothetical protein TNIN_346871 [Trichonephila inaurata madagascariensis]|uniref:Cyclin A n=1 Tax=Trichonephila inaurata madagascariensis TaxID=2747483 RepID=A0A8X6YNG9_9ARAC|nr:hypothetical protein TNIN_346871 [Trichonephila inaurata madagascariensis]
MQCFEYPDITAGANLKIFKGRKILSDLSNTSNVSIQVPKCKINPENINDYGQKSTKNGVDENTFTDNWTISSFPSKKDCKKQTSSIKDESAYIKNLDLPYKNDIFEYLRELELSNRVNLDILHKRRGISMNNRAALVNWLIESSIKYDFTSQMIQKSVYYIDRFLTRNEIDLSEFQELGASALSLAFKYESVYPPPSKFFSEELMLEGSPDSRLTKMEQRILQTLEFQLGYPTSLSFIEIYCSVLGSMVKSDFYFLQYLSEVALLDETICAQYLPSKIGAACLILGNMFNETHPKWPRDLISFTHLELFELIEIVKHLYRFYKSLVKSNYKSVIQKYSSGKYDYPEFSLRFSIDIKE